MTDFDVDPERITVFRIGEEYLFSHYSDRRDLFDDLREYYDGDDYRFEVPGDEWEAVRELLEEAYFEPAVVEELEPYCVVKEKYAQHADVLRNSVAHWERDDHLFFLVKDDLSVREAVERGAERLEDTDFVIGL